MQEEKEIKEGTWEGRVKGLGKKYIEKGKYKFLEGKRSAGANILETTGEKESTENVRKCEKKRKYRHAK